MLGPVPSMAPAVATSARDPRDPWLQRAMRPMLVVCSLALGSPAAALPARATSAPGSSAADQCPAVEPPAFDEDAPRGPCRRLRGDSLISLEFIGESLITGARGFACITGREFEVAANIASITLDLCARSLTVEAAYRRFIASVVAQGLLVVENTHRVRIGRPPPSPLTATLWVDMSNAGTGQERRGLYFTCRRMSDGDRATIEGVSQDLGDAARLIGCLTGRRISLDSQVTPGKISLSLQSATADQAYDRFLASLAAIHKHVRVDAAGTVIVEDDAPPTDAEPGRQVAP